MIRTTPKSWIRWVLVVFLAVGGVRATAQDCLGVMGGSALPGTACDDGLPGTGQDTWTTYCVCVGYCWGSGGQDYALPGSWCNDGNANTSGDIIDGNCVCGGCTFVQGSPGQLCDDGDAMTVLDIIGSIGQCFGWSNHMDGRVFLDNDLNGTYGVGDIPLVGRVVHAGPGANYGITDLNGNFNIGLASPGFYTLAPASGNFDAPGQVFAPVDLSVAGTTSNGNELPMVPTSLEADLTSFLTAGAPRPGFSNSVSLKCRNEGTAATTGTMIYTFDTQQTPSQYYPPGVVAGNTITWNVPVLGISETFLASALMTTSVAAPIGTVLANSTTATAAPPDAAPGNDTYSAGLTVVGSYDPNDIQVSPTSLDMADMAAGLPVTYTVRFQNTGTFLAEDVRIVDVVPLQLRESSFQLVGSSHPCQAQLHGGLLQFLFNDIMLPDSTSDETGSHGWVMFKMRPQNFLLPGASVGNGVSIYFDFNEPIYTNAAVFEIEQSTGVQEAPQDDLRLWPNPVTDVLNISLAGTSGTTTVTIIDVNGRVVRNIASAAVTGSTFTIPVSDLADGLYTLRIGNGLKVSHQRFVKSR
ncbi:MAG: T9SS type A sorting domain-containing protein [Flavobacteriales bacterium]|nr:T9SS type A sorting domain-containing protein [Flavobacteriales bacterium]